MTVAARWHADDCPCGECAAREVKASRTRIADLERCLRLCVTQLERAERYVGHRGTGPLSEPATINAIETARHMLRRQQ